MRKSRLRVIVSGRGRIRTRSAYREFPRPSQGCLWLGDRGLSGFGGNPLGVQRLGPSTYSSQKPGFLERDPTPGEGGFPGLRPPSLLFLLPS